MRVILVDTFGFFFRSYYALPPLYNSRQFPTSLLTGFATLVFNLYKEHKDSCIIFTLEGGGAKRRKEIYPQYKANRKDAPQDLLLQLPVAIEWLEKMGLPTLSIDGYEADDCIATLATLAKNAGLCVQIMSHDKDLYQLIDDDIQIFDYTKKQPITQKECYEKFGVLPTDFIMYQSIVGDSSDNIPGIKGIGPKGAQNILAHFRTLESLYEAISSEYDSVVNLLGKRMAGLIAEHKQEAFMSRELVSLRKDLFGEYDFLSKKNTWESSPLLVIQEDLRHYELQRILQKITPNKRQYSGAQKQTPQEQTLYGLTPQDLKNHQSNPQSSCKNAQFHYIPHAITDENELFSLIDSIPKGSVVAFDCETNGLDVRSADMVGFSFCFDGINGYYVPFLHGGIVREKQEQKAITPNLFSAFEKEGQALFQHDIQPHTETTSKDLPKQVSQKAAKEALRRLFTYQLIGHNIKFDLHIAWYNFGIEPTCIPQDSMVLAWLLDPSQSVSLDNLMSKYLQHSMIAFSDVVPKKATFDSIDIESASRYAAEDAVATFVLYHHISDMLEPHLAKIAHSVEFPFIMTLCYMERAGIGIEYSHFQNLQTTFTQKLQNLQQDIYAKAGLTFNINSPKQLAEVLFETLQLDPKRKIKTGYSTDEQTLLGLQDQHAVVQPLLEYREIFKLLSAYVEPIVKLGRKEHRIYTSFIHTGTSTGRLSSKSPNLQNISVRSELGRSIRKGFVSRNGFMLMSLDYSQIELRLLAHFSKDSVLTQAFHNNADIHATTAKLLFPNAQDSEFGALRNIAKSINFGLIYGMGARKLAQTLSITNAQATQYISNYFATFPSVQQFLQTQKDSILANGYSQTLLGRKRYFDFVLASEFMRANFLREGVNTIFQGSAADLIKLSMNALYKQIEALHDGSCTLLLQVHDELIFEVKEECAEALGKQIKEIMEHIYTLNVPLVCNLSIGHNWAALK